MQILQASKNYTITYKHTNYYLHEYVKVANSFNNVVDEYSKKNLFVTSVQSMSPQRLTLHSTMSTLNYRTRELYIDTCTRTSIQSFVKLWYFFSVTVFVHMSNRLKTTVCVGPIVIVAVAFDTLTLPLILRLHFNTFPVENFTSYVIVGP